MATKRYKRQSGYNEAKGPQKSKLKMFWKITTPNWKDHFFLKKFLKNHYWVKIVLISWVEWNLCSEPPIYIPIRPILVHLISRIILESRKILEFQYWSAYKSSLSRQKSQKKANGQQRGKVATMWQKGHKKAIEIQKDHKKTNILKNYDTQIKGILIFSKSYLLWEFGEKKVFEFLSDLRFMCTVTPIYTHFSPSNFQDNPGSRKILEFQYWSALLNPAVTYATAENQGSLFWISCKRLQTTEKR